MRLTLEDLSNSQIDHARQRSGRRWRRGFGSLLVALRLLLLGLLLLFLTLRLLALCRGLCLFYRFRFRRSLLRGFLLLLVLLACAGISRGSVLLGLLLLYFNFAFQWWHVVEVKVHKPVRFVGEYRPGLVHGLEVLDMIKVSSDGRDGVVARWFQLGLDWAHSQVSIPQDLSFTLRSVNLRPRGEARSRG